MIMYRYSSASDSLLKGVKVQLLALAVLLALGLLGGSFVQAHVSAQAGPPEAPLQADRDFAAEAVAHAANREVYGFAPKQAEVEQLISQDNYEPLVEAAPFPVFPGEVQRIRAILEAIETQSMLVSDIGQQDGYAGSEFSLDELSTKVAVVPGSPAEARLDQVSNSRFTKVLGNVSEKAYAAMSEAFFADQDHENLALTLELGKVVIHKQPGQRIQLQKVVELLRANGATGADMATVADIVARNDVENFEMDMHEVSCTNRYNCGPARSGMYIGNYNSNFSGQYRCTSGFPVKHSSGLYGLLTAAHCRKTGTGWGNTNFEIGVGRRRLGSSNGNQQFVGTWSTHYWDKPADIMVVRMPGTNNHHASFPYMYWDSGNKKVPIVGMATSVANGTPFCNIGMNRASASCGNVIDGNFNTSKYSNSLYLRVNNANIIGGDSGGPNVITGTGGRLAIGITRTSGGGPEFVATKIGYLTTHLGWSLVNVHNHYDSDGVKYHHGKQQFVYDVYDDGLGREANRGEFDYWYKGMKNGNCSNWAKSLAYALLVGVNSENTEMNNKIPLKYSYGWSGRYNAAAKRLDRLYFALMGRGADASGKNYWATYTANATSSSNLKARWEYVVNSFTGGTEFSNRLNSSRHGEFPICG